MSVKRDIMQANVYAVEKMTEMKITLDVLNVETTIYLS